MSAPEPTPPEPRSAHPSILRAVLEQDALIDRVTNEPHTPPTKPRAYSHWELLPLAGLGVTLIRAWHEQANLLDNFNNGTLYALLELPLYHTTTSTALYSVAQLVHKLF